MPRRMERRSYSWGWRSTMLFYQAIHKNGQGAGGHAHLLGQFLPGQPAMGAEDFHGMDLLQGQRLAANSDHPDGAFDPVDQERSGPLDWKVSRQVADPAAGFSPRHPIKIGNMKMIFIDFGKRFHHILYSCSIFCENFGSSCLTGEDSLRILL